MSELTIQPTTPSLGAEIHDVDVTDLSEAGFEQLRAAYVEHGVIFLRDQKLTPKQHIAFAERWGTINVNRFFTPVEGYGQIAEVRKEAEQTFNVGGSWHTDHSYDTVPAMGSILLAAKRCTSTRVLRSASRVGTPRSRALFSNFCTDTRSDPNSRVAFIGSRVRSRSGTTGRPGTMRSTTIRVIAD